MYQDYELIIILKFSTCTHKYSGLQKATINMYYGHTCNSSTVLTVHYTFTNNAHHNIHMTLWYGHNKIDVAMSCVVVSVKLYINM